MRPRQIAPIALLLILGGCSSDGSDDGPETLDDRPGVVSGNPSGLGNPPQAEEPAVPNAEFIGRWRLSSYSLDDGTSKTVPDDIEAGIEIRSDDTLQVNYDACDFYDASYRLDNGVLTTTASGVDPDIPVCEAFYGDADNEERSELLRRSLFDSQTMVALSEDDVLTVTTGRNEVLVFERFVRIGSIPPASGSTPFVGPVWIWSSYQASTGGEEEMIPAVDPSLSPDYTVKFTADGFVEGSDLCNGYTGNWSDGEPDDTSTLLITIQGATEIACGEEQYEAQTATTAAYLRILETASAYSIQNDRLSIVTDTGGTLSFTAAPPSQAPFEKLRTGDLVSLGNDVFTQPRLQVLRDQESLDALYGSLINCGPCTGPGSPEVDFDTSIVIFVAHEIESTGGFDIEVTDVYLTEDSDGVTVDVLSTEPGEGCDVDQGFSGPFAFYRVETRARTVNFNERAEAGPTC